MDLQPWCKSAVLREVSDEETHWRIQEPQRQHNKCLIASVGAVLLWGPSRLRSRRTFPHLWQEHSETKRNFSCAWCLFKTMSSCIPSKKEFKLCCFIFHWSRRIHKKRNCKNVPVPFVSVLTESSFVDNPKFAPSIPGKHWKFVHSRFGGGNLFSACFGNWVRSL